MNGNITFRLSKRKRCFNAFILECISYSSIQNKRSFLVGTGAIPAQTDLDVLSTFAFSIESIPFSPCKIHLNLQQTAQSFLHTA